LVQELAVVLLYNFEQGRGNGATIFAAVYFACHASIADALYARANVGVFANHMQQIVHERADGLGYDAHFQLIFRCFYTKQVHCV
jgi:hypothetical protein